MPGFNNGICFGENGFDFTGGDGSAPATNALGGSNSGVTNRITVQNTSNTASSQATFKATVGGTTSGNCWMEWTVGTTRSWALGIENSASQRLTLSMDAAGSVVPGGGNYIFSVNPGATSFLSSFTFWVPMVAVGGLANPGSPVVLNIQNASTTALSDATLQLNTSTTGGGMPYVSYSSLGNNWWHGVDKTSSSNTFRFQYGNSGIFPALTNVMSMTNAGEITQPLQPAFNAVVGANQTDVTGDATAYTVIFGVEQYDQNADYDATTGIFTAPVAGRYHFNASVVITGILAAHTTGFIYLVTTGGNFLGMNQNPFVTASSLGPTLNLCVGAYANMAAGDTARIQITVSGGTKVIDVNAALANSYFGGKLVA